MQHRGPPVRSSQAGVAIAYNAGMFWWRKLRPLEFIVFGLGNAGLDYARTRHNVGWWVLDELARRLGIEQTVSRHRGQAEYTTAAGQPAALIKPTTFMNRSGHCLAPWLREYPAARWVVVHDDISMACGKLRLRRKGSSGGHMGLDSIITALRTESFVRLKVGVGEPPADEDAAEWVLRPPSPTEEDLLATAVQRAADVVLLLAESRFEEAQQRTGSG